jgi:small subunit ribosomal protein S16
MALKIRLRQQGCTNHIVYRVVVADVRSPRDGKYIESIGWYNPKAKTEALQMELKADRLQHWINQGAQLTPTVVALMKKGAPGVAENVRQAAQAKRVRHAKRRRAASKAA